MKQEQFDRRLAVASAVHVAIRNGWKPYPFRSKYKSVELHEGEYLAELTFRFEDPMDDWRQSLEATIFNHDFAKALWHPSRRIEARIMPHISPWEFTEAKPVMTVLGKEIDQPVWQYHLQQMVIADDPISYLGEYRPKDHEIH